jgi:AraC family transcriptional regulator of adaptative response/methylated-DNA-[protein]-cysteine methyltransferase
MVYTFVFNYVASRPCHRIIGSNGDLSGCGGGIWRKKKLLDLEKANR